MLFSNVGTPQNSPMPAPNIQYTDSTQPDTFARVRYGASKSTVQLKDGVIQIDLAMPLLGHSAGSIESWSASEPTKTVEHDALKLVHTDSFLFGAISLDDPEDYEQASFEAYERIQQMQDVYGFPALLRTWNYFPAIVGHDAQGERYQLFSSGRHRAVNTQPDYETRLPAASALGSHGSGFIIYFLAARRPGIQIENPKQISAFHYPRQYGPRSPSFSRTLIKPWNKATHFYLSGTAAVQGHASKHPENHAAQLLLVLENIGHLLQQARPHYPKARQLADIQLLKVYVRQKEHYEHIRTEVEKHLGTSHPVIYLLADVCRKELLVEIEGFATDAL